MTTPNDGGNAFPANYDDKTTGFGGMSLRDWFAGQAMAAMVAGHLKHNRDPSRRGGDEPLLDYTMPDCEGVIEERECNAPIMASVAYEVADAMLAAREAKR